MPTTYFDNDISRPEGFSNEEHASWLARMLGSTSVHIAPEIWNRLREDAAEQVREKRKYRTQEVSR